MDLKTQNKVIRWIQCVKFQIRFDNCALKQSIFQAKNESDPAFAE